VALIHNLLPYRRIQRIVARRRGLSHNTREALLGHIRAELDRTLTSIHAHAQRTPESCTRVPFTDDELPLPPTTPDGNPQQALARENAEPLSEPTPSSDSAQVPAAREDNMPATPAVTARDRLDSEPDPSAPSDQPASPAEPMQGLVTAQDRREVAPPPSGLNPPTKMTTRLPAPLALLPEPAELALADNDLARPHCHSWRPTQMPGT